MSEMDKKKICDPTWWRLGWVPYVVLVLVAAAADLCFPLVQSHGLQYLGIGSGIGVVLFMTALLLLRTDFNRREMVFLIFLALIAAIALLVSGNHISWLLALTLPFFVIMFGAGKSSMVEQECEYRNWWRFWRDRTRQVKPGFWRNALPTIISIAVGVICFVAFLCIFASGNPVVQLVWDSITTWWNRIMEYLQISWDFWFHAVIWLMGILGFGLFTVARPAAAPVPLPQVPQGEVPAGRSLLPHLPLMILIGINLAFFVATSTDVAFLWFRRVPDGVSQTEYLYEGAASIIWASVLAAALLCYLYRQRGSVRHTVFARSLGYVLLAQTLLLAISVYIRLYNQIEAHSFTPRRILAAEFLLLGVAGLVILLCYMRSSGGFMRHARICCGTLGLMALCFTISKPASLSGDLNMRYAASHPQWNFTIDDFKSDCFVVQDNLAFACYVYQRQQKFDKSIFDSEYLSNEYVRRGRAFEYQLKMAAHALENRYGSWPLFNLRDWWDLRAAEYILGRPIGAAAVEQVH